jgi:hypothetical protein
MMIPDIHHLIIIVVIVDIIITLDLIDRINHQEVFTVYSAMYGKKQAIHPNRMSGLI